MPAVVGDIVNAVINLMSQVPGIATQLYASDRIRQHVQDATLLELEEMWWPDYMTYLGPMTLDGTTGSLTTDLVGPLSNITEYRDIAAVFPERSNKKLREFSQNMNPFEVSGSSPLYVMVDVKVPNRPFKVLPFTTTEKVIVWARQRPTLPMALTDKVYIDQLLIQYDACWMYAVDDGTIPAQVNKFQVLATNRRRMVKAGFGQHPIELDPRFPAGADMFGGEDTTFFVLDEDPLA